MRLSASRRQPARPERRSADQYGAVGKQHPVPKIERIAYAAEPNQPRPLKNRLVDPAFGSRGDQGRGAADWNCGAPAGKVLPFPQKKRRRDDGGETHDRHQIGDRRAHGEFAPRDCEQPAGGQFPHAAERQKKGRHRMSADRGDFDRKRQDREQSDRRRRGHAQAFADNEKERPEDIELLLDPQ